MRPYLFYFLHADGTLPTLVVESCRDDDDARRRLARFLAERPHSAGVEIWQGDRAVLQAELAA